MWLSTLPLTYDATAGAAPAAAPAEGVPGALPRGLSCGVPPAPAVPLLLLLLPLRHSRLLSWFLRPLRLAVTCRQGDPDAPTTEAGLPSQRRL